MTKIFLDSNIWLRYFLKDNNQFESVEKLLNSIEEGKYLPYTSSIVLMEIAFVLSRLYKKLNKEIITCLEAILETRNITILEETDSKIAFSYYKELGIKFSDCLIASQIPKDMIFITYDSDFPKIKSLNVKNPSEF